MAARYGGRSSTVAHRRDQRLPLLRRHARLSKSPYHPLDQRPIGERERRLVDRREQRRLLCRRQQMIERCDRLGHRARVMQPEQLRRERAQVLDGRELQLRRRRAPKARDGALRLDIDREHVGPEHHARAAARHVVHPGSRRGRRRYRGSGRRGRRGRRRRRRNRHDREARGRRRGAQSFQPQRAAAPQGERDAPQRGVVRLHRPHGDTEQRQHMIRGHARVQRDHPHAPRVQQPGQLGDLRVARQQLLAVPVQTGRADLPFHRAERGEDGQRFADLPQRFHHCGMTRRVQPGQPEGRPDGAQGAVDSCGVHGHGISA